MPNFYRWLWWAQHVAPLHRQVFVGATDWVVSPSPTTRRGTRQCLAPTDIKIFNSSK
ncbi:MAG: hypothetical protein SFZ02_11935 [bacterium]|nr:hypothetical protein [bacterium]